MQAARATVRHGEVVEIAGTFPNTTAGLLKRAGAFQTDVGWCCLPAAWPRIEGLLAVQGVALEVIGEPQVAPSPAPALVETRRRSAFVSYTDRLRIQGTLPKPVEKHWLGAERHDGHVGMSPWALEEFLETCRDQGIDVELDASAKALRERLHQRRQVIDGILDAETTDQFPTVPLRVSELKPEQRRALAFIAACNGRAFIADDVGGNKTTTAIGWKLLAKARRIAVVAPANVKGNWSEETARFDGGTALILDGFRKPTTPPPHPSIQWLVTGFDTLLDRTVERKGQPPETYLGWLSYLKGWKPDLVIVDESHNARGQGDSERAKAMQAIAHAVPHALLLTATPQSNSPMDRWSQLNALEPGWWGTWFEYGLAFCDGKQKLRFAGKKRWNYWDMTGTSNADVLSRRMRYVVLSRDRQTLGTHIPSERIPVEVDLTPEARKEYDEVNEQYRAFVEDSKGQPDDEDESEGEAEAGGMRHLSKRMQFILDLRQISSQGRVNHTVDLVYRLVREGKKPVVFAFFVKPLEAIRDGLRARGLRVGFVRGGVKRADRDAIRQQFVRGALDVFVGQTDATGEGVNLQDASYVTVTHDLTYKPINVKQTEGRVNRPGQKHPKTLHFYCLGKDTYDHKTLRILVRKITANQAVERGIEDELRKEIEADFFG